MPLSPFSSPSAFGKIPWIPLDIQLNPKKHKIWFALQEQTQFDFFDVPLEDAGINKSTPLSNSLQGISLRSALHILLQQHDLNLIIDNAVLLITTDEDAAARHRVLVYDIMSQLLDEHETANTLVDFVNDIFPSFDREDIARHRVLAHHKLLIV